jgi:nucleotide-binding universal stress UspA family protein
MRPEETDHGNPQEHGEKQEVEGAIGRRLHSARGDLATSGEGARSFRPPVAVGGGNRQSATASTISLGAMKSRGSRARARAATGALRSAVLGVDGSAHSRRAAAFLARLVPRPAATVTIVTVLEPARAPSIALLPEPLRARLLAEAAALARTRMVAARRRAERASRALVEAGWCARVRVLTGVPLDELLRAVDEARADLLALGARGTTGLERLLLGSVAEGALARSPVPVLIVK